ncbi:MAG: hypothetical protein K2R98_04940, partial [Gemmataceae bacterium]|nr:hypothetical protein [Gemmataceae bacterium]
PNSGPYDITAGPGNTIWFTQNSASKVGTMTLDACPRTVWWDGGGDGVNWTDQVNWSTDQLPGECDDVYIRANPSVTIVHAAGSESIRSLHSDNAISFSGALAVAEGGFVQRTFDLAGVLDVQNAVMALAGGGTLTGTINAAASATVTFTSGLFQVNSGTNLQGTGTYIVGATAPNQTNPILLVAAANISATNFKLLPSGVLTGPGTLTITSTGEWTGGTMSGTGITRVAATATMRITGSGAKSLSERTLENAGTTEWSSFGQSITLASGAQVHNLSGGTFRIVDSFTFLRGNGAAPQFTNEGTFEFGDVDAVCRFEIALTNTGSIVTGMANSIFLQSLTMGGGTYDSPSVTTVADSFVWSSGGFTDTTPNVGQPRSLIIQGMANLESPFLKTLTDFTMINRGSVVLSGLALTLITDSNFINRSVGRFEIKGPTDIRGTAGQALFTNQGTFVKTGPGLAKIRAAFSNALDDVAGPGSVSVESGDLLFSGGMPTMDGTFHVATGCKLEFTSAEYKPGVTSGFSGDGTYILSNDGSLVLPVLPPNREWRFQNFVLGEGGFLDGPGTMSAHVFDWLANGEIRGAGITRVGNGDVMNIEQGIAGSPKILDQRTINNFGTIIWSGIGDLRVTRGAIIVNDGSNAQGFFSIRNNQIINTDGNVANKLVMQNGGIFTKVALGGELGATTINILVENNGGVVALVSLIGNPVNFKGKYNQTAGSTRIEGSLFGVTGTFKVTGGTVAALNGSTIEVQGTLANDGGSLTFDDSMVDVTGDFEQTAGDVAFSNSVVEVSGTLFDDGGTVTMDGSTLTASGGIKVDVGAVLAGSGVIHGDLLNAGLVYVGGMDQAGSLLVDGAFIQQSSGQLSIEIGGEAAGGQYDVLSVTGSADIAGTLNINLIDGFMPELNYPFQIISAGSVSCGFEAVNGLDLGGGATFILIQQTTGFVLVRNA